MAIPVITTTQSVLGYLQWQTWAFQPWADNTPTYWLCTPLPAGLKFDPATGRIHGAATVPGVYEFSLRAGNSSGVSDPMLFAMGIQAASPAQDTEVQLFIDVTSRLVGFQGTSMAASTDPLLWLKRGDTMIFNVTFVKNGATVDLDLATLKFALKEYEPESVLVEGTSWQRLGTGAAAAFRVSITLASDLLDSALSDYEEDTGTQFNALAEFEWTENNPYAVGPPLLRSSSRTFLVVMARDLIPDT